MLKIGDKVRVKKGFKVGNIYDDVLYTFSMYLLKGHIVTISNIKMLNNKKVYQIKELDDFYWSEKMFESVVDSNPMPELKTGMFVENIYGDVGVVVNDRIIYENGKISMLSYIKMYDEYIERIIKSDYGFYNLKKDGTVIWERKEKVKTYLEDFKEKFPNCIMKDNGVPAACTGNCYGFYDCPMEESDCVKCWNAPKGKWEKKG